MAMITEMSPRTEAVAAFDPIAEMCQQLTKGITGLNGSAEKKGRDNSVVERWHCNCSVMAGTDCISCSQ